MVICDQRLTASKVSTLITPIEFCNLITVINALRHQRLVHLNKQAKKNETFSDQRLTASKVSTLESVGFELVD